MDKIGNKIYKLRKERGISQEKFAESLGVSRQTVYKWESNAVNPSTDNIILICNILNVDKNFFYNEKNEVVITEELPFSQDNKPKKVKGLVIFATINFILLFFSVFATVCLYFITNTSNKGYIYSSTSNIDRSVFFIFIVISAILFVTEIVLIIKICKCKHNVNRM